MKTTNNQVQIELHVPSFDTVLDFYSKLGFKKVWLRREEDNSDYLVMERDGMILNFWPGNDNVYEQSYFKRFPKNTKRGYGVEIVMMVDEVQAFHDEIKDFANIVNPLVQRPWGLWDFRIEDPFGYYIRITSKHDILSPEYAVEVGLTDES